MQPIAGKRRVGAGLPFPAAAIPQSCSHPLQLEREPWPAGSYPLTLDEKQKTEGYHIKQHQLIREPFLVNDCLKCLDLLFFFFPNTTLLNCVTLTFCIASSTKNESMDQLRFVQLTRSSEFRQYWLNVPSVLSCMIVSSEIIFPEKNIVKPCLY